MTVINESYPEEFILLGFAGHPWLEFPLFIILLRTYPTALIGNILASTLEPCLHSPMYFFLTNLSFLDMCYTTSIVPQMLFILESSRKTISYVGCAIHLYLFSAKWGTECLLLAIMSFDHYVAICRPQHYSLITNHRACTLLVCVMWNCLSNLRSHSYVTVATLWHPYTGSLIM
ncbi:Olfactory receptor 11 [Lemmus lemmus]